MNLYLCTKSNEGFDQNRSLSIDMGTPHNPGPGQRLVIFGLVSQGHNSGHFLLSNLNFSTSISVLFNFTNAKIALPFGVFLDFFPRRNSILV